MTDVLYAHAAILESIPDAVLVSDLTGTIVFANAAVTHLLGYRPDELPGTPIARLLPDFADNAAAPFTAGQVTAYATKRIHKNAARLDTSVRLANLTDAAGRVIGRTAVLHDVTAQKNTADARDAYVSRLETSNKALDQFAYVASHDLEEQLRNITNYVGLLDRYTEANTDEEVDFFLSVIAQSAARLTTLIRELLLYSRIGKNRVVEPVDCTILVNELLADLAAVIKERGAVIQVDALPVINASAAELKQVFSLLIDNALTYARKGIVPAIQIRCAVENTDWLFSVSDNGIGINENRLTKIFLPLQRLHAQEDYAGTGMGLAIGKKIIESAKGKIWATSIPGRGSVFYFTLPVS